MYTCVLHIIFRLPVHFLLLHEHRYDYSHNVNEEFHTFTKDGIVYFLQYNYHYFLIPAFPHRDYEYNLYYKLEPCQTLPYY